MAGIRVNTGAKRIEVNDNGDYITLNFGDNSMPNRFYAMIDRVNEKLGASVAEAEKIEAEHQRGDDGYSRATAALWRRVHEDIRDEIDGFFGEGTCKKVFGDILPGIELYDDFFNQLIPYFREAGEELSLIHISEPTRR